VKDAFRKHAAELESAMAVLTELEKRQLRALLKKLGRFAAAIDAAGMAKAETKAEAVPRDGRKTRHKTRG
jgi:ribosomal protein L12E/L44/L45/RPP1/RPP2